MENSFQKFFDGLSRGFVSFKDILLNVVEFVRGIVTQITAQIITMMILKKLAGGGAAASTGNPASSAVLDNGSTFGIGGNLPGHATGGSWMVGGAGGTDSQYVGFMATPGERVSVETPGQQRGGGAVNIGITVNAGSGRKEEGTGQEGNLTKLARDLSAMVELKIIEEQRPGGLLAGGRA